MASSGSNDSFQILAISGVNISVWSLQTQYGIMYSLACRYVDPYALVLLFSKFFLAFVLDHYVIHFYPTLIQRFCHNAHDVRIVVNASERIKQRKEI